MVVKSVRGRRRYISFEVPSGTTREDLAEAVERAEARPGSFKVITCKDGKAVVRCSPAERGLVTSALCSIGPGVRSLRTSGTLRTLRDADQDLRVPQKKKR